MIDQDKLRALELIAFDVDGVFTDGRFYLADDGTETKAFNTQDGYGIRQLIEHDIAVAVISGRESNAVEIRMADLGVENVVLGCKDKVAAFDQLILALNIERKNTAYVGDDIPDLKLLQHAGLSIAVANAVPQVIEYCDFVTTSRGGFGAIREISDIVIAGRKA